MLLEREMQGVWRGFVCLLCPLEGVIREGYKSALQNVWLRLSSLFWEDARKGMT